MITSNSKPQCLHLNSASHSRTRATLWPQVGQATQVFRREVPDSMLDGPSPPPSTGDSTPLKLCTLTDLVTVTIPAACRQAIRDHLDHLIFRSRLCAFLPDPVPIPI
jgi:hypothetical protein